MAWRARLRRCPSVRSRSVGDPDQRRGNKRPPIERALGPAACASQLSALRPFVSHACDPHDPLEAVARAGALSCTR